MVNFLRRTWNRYSKLGRKRKNKQKWRRPTGRDNKMREMRKGYPARVKVGYRVDQKISGLLQEKNPVLIYNIQDLGKLNKNEIAIIGKIGKKKKLEIVKMAKEKKIELGNVNTTKFLKKNKKPEESSSKISTKGKDKKIESKDKVKEKKK